MITFADLRDLVLFILRPPPSFVRMVEDAFGPMARRHGMKVVEVERGTLLREITYANAARTIRFWHDVRDHGVGCDYGPTDPPATPDAVDEPGHATWTSVNRRLQLLGVKVPDGYYGLVEEDGLPKAVTLLVWGLERFEREIFPPTEAERPGDDAPRVSA